jgi:hypothetical protein
VIRGSRTRHVGGQSRLQTADIAVWDHKDFQDRAINILVDWAKVCMALMLDGRAMADKDLEIPQQHLGRRLQSLE